jgi:hypothetical protein
MQKLWSKHHVLTSLMIVAAVIVVAAPLRTNAESGRSSTGTPSHDSTTTETHNATTAHETKVEVEHQTEVKSGTEATHHTNTSTSQDRVTEKKDESHAKLADAKLKVCQTREKNITTIMADLSDRGTKRIDVITKIAERTEAFYVKSGKTLANYDALVANVNAKHVAATAAVAAVKDTSVTFKCDGTDPKGAAGSFKSSLKTEDQALKEYKTAVKDLIAGVKSIQGTTTSEHTSTTATTEGKQ